jgi:hypothetical protein
MRLAPSDGVKRVILAFAMGGVGNVVVTGGVNGFDVQVV